MFNTILEATGKFFDPLGVWGERNWDNSVTDSIAKVTAVFFSAIVCIATGGLLHAGHAFFSPKPPLAETQKKIIEAAKKSALQNTPCRMIKIQSAQNAETAGAISYQSLSRLARSFGAETGWDVSISTKGDEQEYKSTAPYNLNQAVELAEKMKSCGAEIYIAESHREKGVWRVLIYTKSSSASQKPSPQKKLIPSDQKHGVSNELPLNEKTAKTEACQKFTQLAKECGKETSWKVTTEGETTQFSTEASFNEQEATELAEQLEVKWAKRGSVIHIKESRSQPGIWRVLIDTKTSDDMRSYNNVGISSADFQNFLNHLLTSQHVVDIDVCEKWLEELELSQPRDSINNIKINFTPKLGSYTIFCQLKDGSSETKDVRTDQVHELRAWALTYKMKVANRPY